MRISDWSSDVCSSDLMLQHGVELRLEAFAVPVALARAQARLLAQEAPLPVGKEAAGDDRGGVGPVLEQQAVALVQAGDRKSVVKGKSVAVRVDLGGSRFIKKKKTKI